jgi:hypothetical protein
LTVSSAPARPAAHRRGLIAFIVLALLLTVGATTVSAVAVTAGHRDFSYAAASGVDTPTKDKPQSKVWYADGFWWGVMIDPTSGSNGDHRIYRYNTSNHTWVATSTIIDSRNSSHGDYLWDGATNSLYVASVLLDSSGAADPIFVFKLNYDPSTDSYTHDSDFGAGGVQVGTGPAETVTIAKDSTGQLWVTYDNPVGAPSLDRDIMVNRSTGAGEHVWGTPFSIGTGIGPDLDGGRGDISAIVAFGGNSVGVMWSDERPDGDGVTRFMFRAHADSAVDTTWGSAVVAGSGVGFAEDHINLKVPSANSGQVLAAVKTNGAPQNPNVVQVLRRNASTGQWTQHVVVGNSQVVTRPQLVVDATNSRVYVFYTAPESFSAPDANVYYKSAPLSTLGFTTSGLGTPFIDDANVRITDVSTSKHPVTQSMGGILGIASGDSNEVYYHGWIPYGSSPPPPGGHPFTDIDGSKFKNDIIWAWEEGITAGCSATRYCPNGLVTRGQMASFLVRALGLPATGTDFFTDDNTSVHEGNINRLRAAGITAGCGGTRFCPNGLVTRGQMATFLVRAYDLAATGTDYFTDDEGLVHEPNINALRKANITSGCGGTSFCPSGIVTRGQMAAFLHRASDD